MTPLVARLRKGLEAYQMLDVEDIKLAADELERIEFEVWNRAIAAAIHRLEQLGDETSDDATYYTLSDHVLRELMK